MRYTEIDGQRYEVKDCGSCPYRDMGDGGWGAHCTHPKASQDPRTPLEIKYDGIAEGCPLRDVQEGPQLTQTWYRSNVKVVMDVEKGILHEVKPCPFCGSTDVREIYYDDEGEPLEEWMMEEANKDGGDYGSWDEYIDVNAYLYYVECKDCHGNVFSKDGREDAWDKWDRRA